jgi:hypothetical protein
VKYLCAILLACAFTAQAEPWTETQQVLAGTYLTAHTIDWAQTRNIATNAAYKEHNPVLGSNPSLQKVDAYFLLTPIIGYFLLDAIPAQRTTVLAIANVLEIGVVAHNFSIGIKARF